MDIILAVLFGAIVGLIVFVIMRAVEFLAPYANIGGLLAFLLVVLTRLSGRF